jgi:hypothetical protein
MSKYPEKKIMYNEAYICVYIYMYKGRERLLVSCHIFDSKYHEVLINHAQQINEQYFI